MIDIQILRVLQERKDYTKLRASVPDAALEPTTRTLLNDFGEYFKKFPDVTRVEAAPFWTWFSKFRHVGMNEEQRNVYLGVVRNACTPPDDSIKESMLAELRTLRLSYDCASALTEWEDGNVPDLLGKISAAVDSYKLDSGITAPSWIASGISDLLKEEEDNSGVRWRLQTLAMHTRGLRPGDMGIVAARPDKGKTTFFASEVTYMAHQLPEDKNIIWLNNEGLGKRIIPRLYQAALGCSLSELVEMNKKGILEAEYIKVVGRLDRIRVFDVHGYTTGRIEHIIEENNPGIVIADMIDHIKGFNSEARTDLQLEEMYKWFRERAVKHGFIGLASSQISNEGDGLQFPTLGMLKDSKTGKQGACDFLLMIGASNDPSLSGSRFLGMPKNKLRREGAPGDPRTEVVFNPNKCRYEDIALGE